MRDWRGTIVLLIVAGLAGTVGCARSQNSVRDVVEGQSAPVDVKTGELGKYQGYRTNELRELALAKDEHAFDVLVEALQYYDRPYTRNTIGRRRQAAEALGVLGDRRAIQPLEDALNDPDFLVRQRAAESLAVLRHN